MEWNRMLQGSTVWDLFRSTLRSKNRKFVGAKSRVLHVACPAEAIDITKEDLMKDDASSPGPAETNEQEVLPAIQPRSGVGNVWDMLGPAIGVSKWQAQRLQQLKGLARVEVYRSLRICQVPSPKSFGSRPSVIWQHWVWAALCVVLPWYRLPAEDHTFIEIPSWSSWLATSICLFPDEVTFEQQLKEDRNWRFFPKLFFSQRRQGFGFRTTFKSQAFPTSFWQEVLHTNYDNCAFFKLLYGVLDNTIWFTVHDYIHACWAPSRRQAMLDGMIQLKFPLNGKSLSHSCLSKTWFIFSLSFLFIADTVELPLIHWTFLSSFFCRFDLVRHRLELRSWGNGSWAPGGVDANPWASGAGGQIPGRIVWKGYFEDMICTDYIWLIDYMMISFIHFIDISFNSLYISLNFELWFQLIMIYYFSTYYLDDCGVRDRKDWVSCMV